MFIIQNVKHDWKKSFLISVQIWIKHKQPTDTYSERRVSIWFRCIFLLFKATNTYMRPVHYFLSVNSFVKGCALYIVIALVYFHSERNITVQAKNYLEKVYCATNFHLVCRNATQDFFDFFV